MIQLILALVQKNKTQLDAWVERCSAFGERVLKVVDVLYCLPRLLPDVRNNPIHQFRDQLFFESWSILGTYLSPATF